MPADRMIPREAPDGGRGATVISSDRPSVLCFVADETSEAALRGGLAEVAPALQVRRGTVRTAAKALEREMTPRSLIVDVSGIDDPFGALDELASVCAPDVRVLVVGERAEISFYRELTRDIGVTEYLHKPLTRDNVARMFGPHISGAGAEQTGAAERGGQVTAVCGVHGGVGATTVAVNLALQLAEVTHGHVALLDLNLRCGATTMMLGVRASSGLRVALEEPDRADALFLDRVGIPVEERLRLIAAEEPMEAEVHPSEEGVRRIVDMLRQRFNHVVVDLPMPPNGPERAVLQRARHCVLVFKPDVASLRDTMAARKLATATGSENRVLTVLNHAGMPGGLNIKLVKEGLGSAPDATIPDLPRVLPRAANLGRPALRESAALRRGLAPLTQEIGAVRTVASSKSLFGRLLKRGNR